MTRTGEASRLLMWAAIACSIAAGRLEAQAVRGRLRAESGGAGPSAAVVQLRDARGVVVDATLTDAAGAFSLDAPGGGTYTLFAAAPGFRDAERPATVGADAILVELVTQALSLDLPGGRLTPDRRCRLPGDGAERVAALWAEVRKAFEAMVLAEDGGMLGHELRTWTRRLDPADLHTVDEQVRPAAAFVVGSPFRSPPAEELAQFGYIQGGESEGYTFLAPDARTLLSPVFASTHCLGYAVEGPEAGWVGLTFRPRFDGGMDVEGTLWIDARTLGPRRLEFRYTALPWSVDTDDAGGRIDFHQLEAGPWIVRRWWIRSPRVGVRTVRLTPWDRPRQRFGLAGLVEEGGEVLRIQTTDGRIERLGPDGAESG